MMVTKERNYGIDLLRIVSMFMVVVLHVLGHGGILEVTLGLTIKGEVAWFIEIACYCAVNCYALISGYIAYKSRQKWRNFIYLWLQVFFYCFIIGAINIAIMFTQGTFNSLGLGETIKLVLNMFLPVLTNQYWYFTAYAGLFVCIPLLNLLIEHAPRKILRNTLILLSLLLYVGERLFSAFSFGFRDGYSFPWLALVYVIGGYISRYKPFEKISIGKSLFYYTLCIVVTFLGRVAIEFVLYLLKGQVIKNSFESLIIAYTTPTILLAAIFLLHSFSKITVGKIGGKIITFFATLSFGVYLIHVNPIVFSKLSNIFVSFAEKNVFVMVGLIFVASITIFIACIAIDLIRKLLFDLCRVKQFSIRLEDWATKILNKIDKRKNVLVPEEVRGNGHKE